MSSISTFHFALNVTCNGGFVRLCNLKWASGQWDCNQIALRNVQSRAKKLSYNYYYCRVCPTQHHASLVCLFCNRRGCMSGSYCCGWWNNSWLIFIAIFISIMKDKQQGRGKQSLVCLLCNRRGRMGGSYCCGWWNYSWLIWLTVFISIIKERQTAGKGKNRKCRTWESIKEEIYLPLCSINVNKAK